MLDKKKKMLINEADKQAKALKNLRKWLRNCIAFSTIGLVIAFWGIKGLGVKFVLGVTGIIVMVICIIVAIIINMGIKNGEQNVKKILKIVGQL